MIIKNGMVFTEEKTFTKRDIYMVNGRFCKAEDIAQNTEDVLDVSGCYVIPGLLDIHFHGCMGHDFCDADLKGLKKMAEYELENGVTAICPASMTFSEELLSDIFKVAAEYKKLQQTSDRLEPAADLVGINMEGPFISEEKKGAQNGLYIHKPDADMFYRLQEAAGGLIKLVDIAPETDGAINFIEKTNRAVRISLAHTAASFDEAKLAFEKGAKQVTHLYNAMVPFSHREPGVLGALNEAKDASAELICDGVHLHPSTVQMTFDLLGDDRIILISDTMRACGLDDGKYTLGGQEVTVKGNLATLTQGENIAGSVTNLMNCLRISVKNMGIPLESAVKAATVNPAKAIGIYDEYGSISEKKRANAVILDKELNIRYVIKDGITAVSTPYINEKQYLENDR